MQIYIGMIVVLLTVGVAYLSTKGYSFLLLGWSFVVIAFGGMLFNRLDNGGGATIVDFAYAVVAAITLATVAWAAATTRESVKGGP